LVRMSKSFLGLRVNVATAPGPAPLRPGGVVVRWVVLRRVVPESRQTTGLGCSLLADRRSEHALHTLDVSCELDKPLTDNATRSCIRDPDCTFPVRKAHPHFLILEPGFDRQVDTAGGRSRTDRGRHLLKWAVVSSGSRSTSPEVWCPSASTSVRGDDGFTDPSALRTRASPPPVIQLKTEPVPADRLRSGALAPL
jgi:hypothetical protein